MGKSVDIVCLTRCKERTTSLAKCLFQSTKDMPESTGLKIMTVLIPDRPTKEVRDILNTVKEFPNVIVVPEEAGGFNGHRWGSTGGLDLLNRGLEYFDSLGHTAEWVWMRDDDWIFQESYKTELVTHLRIKNMLAFNLVSLFVWGQDAQGSDVVNLNQFHMSPIISRYKRGHRWPTDGRSICVTKEVQEKILRNPRRTKTLPFFLLDYGASSQKEREAMAAKQKAAGKDDRFTKAWTEEPLLVRLIDILVSGKHPLEVAEEQMRRKGILR